MKKCPKCKAEIQEEARFCLYCMTSFEEKQTVEIPKENNKLWPYIVAAVLVVALVLISIFLFMPKGKHSDASNDISAGSSIDNTLSASDDNDIGTSASDEISSPSSNNQPQNSSKNENHTTSTSTGSISPNNTSTSTATNPTTSSNTSTNNSTANNSPTSGNSQNSSPSNNRQPQNSSKNENHTTNIASTGSTSPNNTSTSTATNPTTSSNTSTNNSTANNPPTSGNSQNSSPSNNTTASSPSSITTTSAPTPSTATPTNTTTSNAASSTPTDTQPKYTYVTATIENAYPSGYSTLYPPENAIVITKVNYKEASGNYVIPDTIDGKKVGAIMPLAFSDPSISSTVKSVTLPGTVRTIWSDAFKDCFNLSDLYIKSAVIGIYEDAFPDSSKRNNNLTIHCKRDCRDFDFYYYRNIADRFDADYEEWNG